MIELITARGNTSLESAVTLTKDLRWDIQALGVRLSQAAADEETSRNGSSKAKTRAHIDLELKNVIADMKSLLERIEDAVPLINLAITTSGVSLSTNLPVSVSPSRLLQASTFLSAGDAHYASKSAATTQIGPAFTLSMYMLFAGHSSRVHDEEELRNTTWQEVIHKVRVKLLRTTLDQVGKIPFCEHSGDYGSETAGSMGDEVPRSIPAAAHIDEFAYELLLVEDLDDDRVHTVEDGQPEPGRFDDVTTAGIREVVPIHQISKIFYADTGKILNIGSDGETNNPVLLLKRDMNAAPPRRMMPEEERQQEWDPVHEEDDNDLVSELDAQFARESTEPADTQPIDATHEKVWRLPTSLDPEWIALEVYIEEPESDSDPDMTVDEDDITPPKGSRFSRQSSLEPGLTSALSNLRLSPASTNSTLPHGDNKQVIHLPNGSPMHLSKATIMSFASGGPIRTSLSLLEMLIRLTSLQQFQQASHLTITDELLNFFLEESSTTGAAPGDVEARKRIRVAARQRVGFDPYDESPIKRRGEEYQYHHDDAYANGYATPPPAQSGRSETPERSQQNRTPTKGSDSRSFTPGTDSPNKPVGRRNRTSLATPPGATKSRQAFLRHEGSQSARGSPLAKSSSRLSDDGQSEDGM